jgi:hypothetical protein
MQVCCCRFLAAGQLANGGNMQKKKNGLRGEEFAWGLSLPQMLHQSPSLAQSST